MSPKFHAKAFDENTRTKLELFRRYLMEWLPVFLKRGQWNVNVFDFFCGPGRDVKGQPGSPILILEALNEYREDVDPTRVDLFFNDRSGSNIRDLQSLIEPMGSSIPAQVHIENLDFAEAFELWLPRTSNSANLIFLDQQGIKQITPKVFNRLIELEHTDVLFFMASSSIRRFHAQPSFKKYIETERIDLSSHNNVHRAVAGYYKSLVPEGVTYHVAQYSLKKGANIYGLVFGSHHPLGALKFLEGSWKLDEHRGEANYDIDDDRIREDQPALFPEMNRSTKLNLFEADLREAVLEGGGAFGSRCSATSN